jgi:hypothetical protein
VLSRLLHAISITQRHLRFWQARLKAGSHGSFLLLGRGPGGFAADVLERLGVRQQQQTGISASDRIQERVSEAWRGFLQASSHMYMCSICYASFKSAAV